MDKNAEAFKEASDACVENGKRLLEDSKNLRESGRFPTAKALAVLAQEEFAKAYIMRLVQEGAIPWCNEIHRATRDHHCKQLMGILMEYLFTPWHTENLLERERRVKEKFPDFRLPRKVADALNIFCHEKIKRWKSSSWCWAEEPEYDVEAKAVWRGTIEETKQNALYVSLGKDGRVANKPQSDGHHVDNQIAYAEILEEVASGNDCFAFTEKEYVKSTLKEIFGSIYAK